MELVFGFLGAIFADLRKVVLDSLLGKELKWGGPYSLGKLIDWKHYILVIWVIYYFLSLLARETN